MKEAEKLHKIIQAGRDTLRLYFCLYNTLSLAAASALTTSRAVGSFSFTFGSVILFLFIIWLANFLQKYIGYFFGDIGEEVLTGNKAYRSRLLITCLILLIGGFLLAVAASGLPMDRVTVILDALGVGVRFGPAEYRKQLCIGRYPYFRPHLTYRQHR